jgi:hypothetical protein
MQYTTRHFSLHIELLIIRAQIALPMATPPRLKGHCSSNPLSEYTYPHSDITMDHHRKPNPKNLHTKWKRNSSIRGPQVEFKNDDVRDPR